MAVLRGADLLSAALAREGVRQVFGMPGSHSTAVYDALRCATTLVRNEQAGAFAADGYARVSGRPGVICTTAGPGATNALSGVAEAWADSVPLLLLAGQVNADRLHEECGAYHEIDLEAIFRPAAKWCRTIRDLTEVPALVADAFTAMTTGRPRTAVLILPQDLMRRELTNEQVEQRETPCSISPPALPLPADRIAEAALLLARAERPVVLAGGGALWSGAAEAVRALAEALHAPVLTTLNGKGILDERDPLSLGHARSVRARALLPRADAMLAVGCRFTEVMTDWHRMPVPQCLVQIDIDPAQIGMNYPVAVGIEADARDALSALLAALPKTRNSAWGDLWEQARSARHPRPEWLIETLRDVLPDDAPVFTDACEMGYRMQADWEARGPRRFFYPSNFITLGWAFPAAIGAAVALDGVPVVSVSGDGGFVMTAQELATAARYSLPVIALIHNDSTYGAIKNIQKRDHAGRYRDVDLNNPDFVAFAGAYGVPARRAAGPDELRAALRAALSRSGPSVIEVPDTWRSLRDVRQI